MTPANSNLDPRGLHQFGLNAVRLRAGHMMVLHHGFCKLVVSLLVIAWSVRALTPVTYMPTSPVLLSASLLSTICFRSLIDTY